MARIKLGALITEMSGSIGGYTVQKNHYGTSLKVKNNPIRSISQSQSLRRGEISSLIPLWQNLTDGQRLQWNNYTSYNRQTAKNNADSLLSGYNLFLKYNVLRLYAGISVTLEPTYGLSNFVNTLPLNASTGLQNTIIAGGDYSLNFTYSHDSLNYFSSLSSLFSSYTKHIAFNGSTWVATGRGGNSLAYSNDGINWTGLGTSIFSTQAHWVIWDGTKFIATGQGTNSIAHSSDGINWTGQGTSTFSSYCFGIAFNGTQYLAVGNGANSVAYSSDGISWNYSTTQPFSNYATSVIWDSSKWVITGRGTYNFATTTDGITLNPSNISSFTAANVVSFNGSIYLFGSTSAHPLVSSSDLSTFTPVAGNPFSSTVRDIIWNGTYFIAAGSSASSSIMLSTDGLNWINPTSYPSLYATYGLGGYPQPLILPNLSSRNLFFASEIDITKMSCIVKTSQPLNRPDNILKQKLRIISPITIDNNGITWSSSFENTWGRNPIAGEWINIETTFFSLVSSIVYKPVTQLCQLT